MIAKSWIERLRAAEPVLRMGRVRKVMPTCVVADGPSLPLGALCEIEAHDQVGAPGVIAEVVRVNEDSIVLSPFEDVSRTFAGAQVRARTGADRVPVGAALLGRAVDALGRPIDDKGNVKADRFHPLRGNLLSPLDRITPKEVLETGVRAIDGLLTLGKGQRVGIFAASGVGKTSLMARLARQVKADMTILCLVGERGREVESIWHQGLDAGARSRATLVAATADQSAAKRVRAGQYALALAEYWRAEGKHVLLLLDSVTRLAMAMRELGLAAGEPPTMRAYTPNVFSAIPKMIERCGAVRTGGAITAIVTVLSETDDVDDPICELMKSLLDGHLVLSRALSEVGHFPAIDVIRSVSRQADDLLPGPDRNTALQVLEWMGTYESARTLIDSGIYSKGSNERIDRAIERRPEVLAFLRQGREEHVSVQSTFDQLRHTTLRSG